jgi:DNA-binding ferritin-like protein
MSNKNKLMLSEATVKEFENIAASLISSCMNLYKGEDYAELGILLGFLRALSMLHQSHHWQAYGSNSYQDHLLFERAYDSVTGEVDKLAEKAVGIGDKKLTNYFVQLKHMEKFLGTVNKQEDLVKQSYRAELLLLAVGADITLRIKEAGLMTEGLDDLLTAIFSTHETSAYLLGQRTNKKL